MKYLLIISLLTSFLFEACHSGPKMMTDDEREVFIAYYKSRESCLNIVATFLKDSMYDAANVFAKGYDQADSELVDYCNKIGKPATRRGIVFYKPNGYKSYIYDLVNGSSKCDYKKE